MIKKDKDITKSFEDCTRRDIGLGEGSYLCKLSKRKEDCLNCPYDRGGLNEAKSMQDLQ